MAASELISCQTFQSFLVSQLPVYDTEILKDVRPTDGTLLGYYMTGTFDAYSGVQHTFDRFNSVYPNLTVPWNPVITGNCVGNPCDPVENKIGWGWTRNQYGLEEQSWGSPLLCFDEMMTRTKAKEHWRQIIDDILRPATTWIMTGFLMRKAAELADNKVAVAPGLPAFTFTWDPGGYIFMNPSQNPTGKLTANILRSRVRRQYMLGATQAGREGFDHLELHTDMDTYHDLCREDATLKAAWRFAEFDPAQVEFYKYGFSGMCGDFMVKCLQFPPRFNKVAAGRYQVVLPYKNVAANEGIKSVFNEDYDKAQYQWSYINNKRAIRVLPFNPEPVSQEMPFLIRDYGGKWRFVMHDLGGDANGLPIDNSRQNKGKFIADFRLAAKPEHTEWLELLFHMVDKPCVTIVTTCNPDPGYPAQSYNSANAECPCTSQITLTAIAGTAGQFNVAANSIKVNGAAITHGAVTGATLTAFVTNLNTAWSAASQVGTWAVVDAPTNKIGITYTASQNPANSIEIPFTI